MPLKKRTKIVKKYTKNMIDCSKHTVYKMSTFFRFHVVSQKDL